MNPSFSHEFPKTNSSKPESSNEDVQSPEAIRERLATLKKTASELEKRGNVYTDRYANKEKTGQAMSNEQYHKQIEDEIYQLENTLNKSKFSKIREHLATLKKKAAELEKRGNVYADRYANKEETGQSISNEQYHQQIEDEIYKLENELRESENSHDHQEKNSPSGQKSSDPGNEQSPKETSEDTQSTDADSVNVNERSGLDQGAKEETPLSELRAREKPSIPEKESKNEATTSETDSTEETPTPETESNDETFEDWREQAQKDKERVQEVLTQAQEAVEMLENGSSETMINPANGERYSVDESIRMWNDRIADLEVDLEDINEQLQRIEENITDRENSTSETEPGQNSERESSHERTRGRRLIDYLGEKKRHTRQKLENLLPRTRAFMKTTSILAAGAIATWVALHQTKQVESSDQYASDPWLGGVSESDGYGFSESYEELEEAVGNLKQSMIDGSIDFEKGAAQKFLDFYWENVKSSDIANEQIHHIAAEVRALQIADRIGHSIRRPSSADASISQSATVDVFQLDNGVPTIIEINGWTYYASEGSDFWEHYEPIEQERADTGPIDNHNQPTSSDAEAHVKSEKEEATVVVDVDKGTTEVDHEIHDEGAEAEHEDVPSNPSKDDDVGGETETGSKERAASQEVPTGKVVDTIDLGNGITIEKVSRQDRPPLYRKVNENTGEEQLVFITQDKRVVAVSSDFYEVGGVFVPNHDNPDTHYERYIIGLDDVSDEWYEVDNDTGEVIEYRTQPPTNIE